MMKKNNIQISFAFIIFLFSCLIGSFSAQARVNDFAAPGQSLSIADYSLLGTNVAELTGKSIASAGDVDGDGLADLLVGALYNNDIGSHAGKVYLILGKTMLTGITSLSSADYMFTGENAGDYAGTMVASAGDVDGDGLSDILISAEGNEDAGDHAGKVYLILAKSLVPGTQSLSIADYAYTGLSNGHTGTLLGESVTSAGDVDGDGLDDILVTASTLSSTTTSRYPDAYLILAKSLVSGTASITTADYKFYDSSSSGASYASSLGDVDGDGLSDVIVSTYISTGGGITTNYIFLGRSLIPGNVAVSSADYIYTQENALDLPGGHLTGLAGAGDVDGDGLSDILIGATNNDEAGSNAGKVYLILASSLSAGSKSLATADYQFTGEAASNFAGRSVSGLGDIDGDGLSDILIGANGNSDSATAAGKAYIVLSSSLSAGTTSLSNADYMFLGEGSQSFAGEAVANAGDVNGDGTNDIFISAEGFDGSRSSSDWIKGKSYLILSNEICTVHADAGPDQVVDEGVTVTLDGSGSFTSCSSGSLTYSWEVTYYSSPVTLSDTTAIYPTFTSGVDGDIYVFTLTVEGDGHSDSDTIVVTVHSNTAPVANNVSLITTSSRASLGPDATDADGDIFTNYYYHLDRKPTRSRASISPTGYSTIPATVINMDLNGTYVISYKVYDGREWSNTATITIVKRPDFDY